VKQHFDWWGAGPLATPLPKTSKNVPWQKKNQASYAGFAQSCW